MFLMDFLYHQLSEKDKEDIKKQVDGILVSFSKKLNELDEGIKEQDIEREECTRKEQTSEKEQENAKEKVKFSRKKMFENAPEKNEDFIIAEKKKW